MAKMTGGEAFAKSLYREGVRVIFGLPGVQLYGLLDGLAKEPGIRFINTRHEQATTYMADGYARAGGDIGTALVVPGPGLQNASAGIGTAYSASSPVLVLAGQVERDLIGVERGMLHEIKGQMDTIKPVTKHQRLVLEAEDIPEAVHEAMEQLKTGRPRPVEIEIPPETLYDVADIELLEEGKYERPGGNPESIKNGADLIASADNPLFWAGGGVISAEASSELTAIAEFLQAPVITTGEGRGAISDRSHLSIGSFRFKNDTFFENRIDDHDLIIAVGTRMAYPEFLKGQKVLQIDIDEEEIGRNYTNTEGILGDAKKSLGSLLEALQTRMEARDSRREELSKIKEERFNPSTVIEPQNSYVEAIRRAMPDDGILISGMTQIGYYSRNKYEVYEPRTYLTSSYYGNLGFAYPTALGAKVARPDKPVVAVSGDGGFMFNVQELSTAVHHKINAIVVVFNDNAFGNVMRDQVNMFDGREYGAIVHNPDFMKLADAFGARGVRIEDGDPESLEKELSSSINIEAPTLIEVPVGEMPNPFRDY
ncbi:MAG: thiamine pyrophosphate-binding protein [SAR202 cluster bacterium]|nr:MAG: thiamine pyrophosphate-binding protein [SAR202 cluster bacterium]MQF68467.1 thiamine pyrophosphate-binding protein [SAR202 cluster bacterium AD-802-K11_MRT_200m]